MSQRENQENPLTFDPPPSAMFVEHGFGAHFGTFLQYFYQLLVNKHNLCVYFGIFEGAESIYDHARSFRGKIFSLNKLYNQKLGILVQFCMFSEDRVIKSSQCHTEHNRNYLKMSPLLCSNALLMESALW